MATDAEILKLWNSLSAKKNPQDAAIELYRLAQDAGKQECLAVMEKEMLSDAAIEEAIKLFGFGGNKKSGTITRMSVITQRAIIREAIHIAKERLGK